MNILTLKCPACGASIDDSIRGRIAVCAYCGTKVMIEDAEHADLMEEMNDPYSDLSLKEFAARVCKDFLDSADPSYFKNTPKILKGLGIGSSETVWLIHDDTFMKSGKNGFAITDKGIYCRPMGEATVFTGWEQFGSSVTPLEIDGSYIKMGSRPVCYFTDNSDVLEGDLNLLYQRIHRQAVGCAAR